MIFVSAVTLLSVFIVVWYFIQYIVDYSLEFTLMTPRTMVCQSLIDKNCYCDVEKESHKSLSLGTDGLSIAENNGKGPVCLAATTRLKSPCSLFTRQN